MKKIYISGRISGLTIEESTAKFAEAEKMLNEKGWECVNPMTLVPFDPKLDWVDYMVKDIEAILRDCDRVYMLDSWGQSRGARVERAIAIEEGMKVYYFEKDVPYRTTPDNNVPKSKYLEIESE